MADKQQEKKKENRFNRWWRETVGELRKVNWPTTTDALRMTRIVLAVMAAMAVLLGLLDYVFSTLITLLLA